MPALGADLPTRCETPAAMLELGRQLPRLSARLSRQEAVLVVAIGSSSTAGAGASSPEHSYPAQLAALWPDMLGGGPLKMINRGINGQDVPQMVARLKQDAIDLNPDLVLWQLGTNDVLRSKGVEVFRATIRKGIAALQASGSDVVLVDLQYAPKVLQDPDHEAMQTILAELAAETKVGLFRRFDLMRHWLRPGGLSQRDLTDPDELHMTDLGYACWARAMAHALRQASRQTRTANSRNFNGN